MTLKEAAAITEKGNEMTTEQKLDLAIQTIQSLTSGALRSGNHVAEQARYDAMVVLTKLGHRPPQWYGAEFYMETDERGERVIRSW